VCERGGNPATLEKKQFRRARLFLFDFDTLMNEALPRRRGKLRVPTMVSAMFAPGRTFVNEGLFRKRFMSFNPHEFG
jgi:hypothetical protein